ncbi:MAG: HEAT repeat domain-containing protein [Acidobacteria bacterium]|nr:HEAT repeat domain-containing protein [Acidobacteriota bacterium]
MICLGLAVLPAFPDEAGGKSGIEGMLAQLESQDSYERHRAVVALGKSGDRTAVEPLIRLLGDSDYFVRAFAASALADLGEREAVDSLIRVLGDESDRVRRSAAEALGRLRDPKALDPLAALLGDPDVFVRRTAAMALGDLGHPDAAGPLVQALADRDGYVRNGAALALRNLGSGAVPALVGALGDWRAGPPAAEALADLGWEPVTIEERVRYNVAVRDRAALLRNREETLGVLRADARDGNRRQLEWAVYALIGIGEDAVIGELEGILRAKGDPGIARALVESGNARLVSIARSWAEAEGVEIPVSGEGAAVGWGGM